MRSPRSARGRGPSPRPPSGARQGSSKDRNHVAEPIPESPACAVRPASRRMRATPRKHHHPPGRPLCRNPANALMSCPPEAWRAESGGRRLQSFPSSLCLLQMSAAAFAASPHRARDNPVHGDRQVNVLPAIATLNAAGRQEIDDKVLRSPDRRLRPAPGMRPVRPGQNADINAAL